MAFKLLVIVMFNFQSDKFQNNLVLLGPNSKFQPYQTNLWLKYVDPMSH